MLYKKNQSPALDPELFRSPTSEYRGAPFWAWNCRLELPELLRQLEVLKQMGFGGAHLHVRTGMATPYLSDEYMALIKACADKAKSEGMLTWLYDEDRWPSGAAGGLVTKEKKYRARSLVFSPERKDADGEDRVFIAAYDVRLNDAGDLAESRRIGEDDEAAGDKWYAYRELQAENPWYNNQTYINTLDKAAMDRFIDITYAAYDRTVAEEFDKTIYAIFTDEPQFSRKEYLNCAKDKRDVHLPWADDLPETFAAAYPGEDLLESLPELFWERADGLPSTVRYHYHDHTCERFTEAFADNCGAWCRAHGIALTGHMVEEPTLHSQTCMIGEAMRAYRGFDLPGMDMLCADFEYTTAKQVQSAVHQFGREGMTSELYGVTNWDFDFRGHKLHGDWQAALGTTVRVPHLAWVSMAGEAKRDYPASINYQSPWWKKYPLVEDHFARLNTALTRGKPIERIGVIHPIESFWLHWGSEEKTGPTRWERNGEFLDMAQWLLFAGLDYDYICESLFPEQCKAGGAPLTVGEMAYDAVLVPGCETLRSTTVERLEAFAATGGRLIFAGRVPTLVDAVPSDRVKKLAAGSVCVPWDEAAVTGALEDFRTVGITENGALTKDLIYQLRQDGDSRWLFVAHGRAPADKDDTRRREITLTVSGTWCATVYDTVTGETYPAQYTQAGGKTEIAVSLCAYDSVLLHLTPGPAVNELPRKAETAPAVSIPVPDAVPFSLSEPNALLLDRAEYALDGGEWQPSEEILRLDNNCRRALGWPLRLAAFAQPWVVPEEPTTHEIHLRFTVRSEIDMPDGVELAIEDAEVAQIVWNGEQIPSKVTGFYVDHAIKTVALPGLWAGENTLEVTLPFGRRTNVEWCYILGKFGVRTEGTYGVIIPMPQKLTFGDITTQGLPFYGGNVVYHIPLPTEGGEVSIFSPRYRGSLQTACVDYYPEKPLTFPPYSTVLGSFEPGVHTLYLCLYGHRRNGFGPVHMANQNERWIGPDAWRTRDERWSDEFRLTQEGVLTPPVITETPQNQ